MNIKIVNLSRSFRVNGTQVRVLDNINFDVRENEFVTFIGPSGCGKSTILNILAGFISPDSGFIYLNGKRVSNLATIAAYMVQKDLLLPWRTVLGNALLGPEIRGDDMSIARREAEELLSNFGLQDFINSYPHELSGGMRQRVALARTLLFKRPLLLLDEPFGALDAMTRFVMQNLLLRVHKKYRKTVILVTHDIDEALLLSDRIFVLSARPARVKSVYEIKKATREREVKENLKEKIFSELKEEIGTVFRNGEV